jgi:hypothetical protein
MAAIQAGLDAGLTRESGNRPSSVLRHDRDVVKLGALIVSANAIVARFGS